MLTDFDIKRYDDNDDDNNKSVIKPSDDCLALKWFTLEELRKYSNVNNSNNNNNNNNNNR